MKLAVACTSFAIVTGCISTPKVALQGAFPYQGTFGLGDAARGSPELIQRVRDGLIAHGLTESREATYFVQTSLAERNVSSGIAVSATPDEWLRIPVRGSGHVVQFDLTLTRASDGVEIFRATVAKSRAHIDAKIIQRLVDAVYARIKNEASGAHEVKQR